MLEIDPHFDPAIWPLGMAYIGKRQFDDAVRVLAPHAHDAAASPETLPALGVALALRGDRTGATEIITELERRSASGYFPAGLIGMVYLALGATDRAFALFSQALDERSLFASWLNAWPLIEPHRKDKRFADFRQRLGL